MNSVEGLLHVHACSWLSYTCADAAFMKFWHESVTAVWRTHNIFPHRRCPGTNPGVNGSIPYPCPGGFSFPVGGDFVQENTLYNGIPAFYPPPPNPFTAPVPAPAISATPANLSTITSKTSGRRRLSQTGSDLIVAPLAAPKLLQSGAQGEQLYWCLCLPDERVGTERKGP